LNLARFKIKLLVMKEKRKTTFYVTDMS